MSKLTSLAAGLRALGCTLDISVVDNARIADAAELSGQIGYRTASSGRDGSGGDPSNASSARKRRRATSAE